MTTDEFSDGRQKISPARLRVLPSNAPRHITACRRARTLHTTASRKLQQETVATGAKNACVLRTRSVAQDAGTRWRPKSLHLRQSRSRASLAPYFPAPRATPQPMATRHCTRHTTRTSASSPSDSWPRPRPRAHTSNPSSFGWCRPASASSHPTLPRCLLLSLSLPPSLVTVWCTSGHTALGSAEDIYEVIAKFLKAGTCGIDAKGTAGLARNRPLPPARPTHVRTVITNQARRGSRARGGKPSTARSSKRS